SSRAAPARPSTPAAPAGFHPGSPRTPRPRARTSGRSFSWSAECIISPASMSERKPVLDPTTRAKIARAPVAARLADHQLLVLEGADQGRRFALERLEVRVGQDPASEVALSDPAVSRHHLTLAETPEGCLLTDPGSRNGTLVN